MNKNRLCAVKVINANHSGDPGSTNNNMDKNFHLVFFTTF